MSLGAQSLRIFYYNLKESFRLINSKLFYDSIKEWKKIRSQRKYQFNDFRLFQSVELRQK